MAAVEPTVSDRREQPALDARGRRRRAWLALVVIIALAAVVEFAGVPRNPPGFYIDESSIAYNAHTIAQTGRDEFGNRWPLFFRAFGDYKNPVHIYLLAALFKLTGPSIFAARLLSALAGLATAFLFGLLAERITRRRDVALAVGVSALLTPWLFELSRVVVEVTLYPLVLALLLLCLHAAQQHERWNWRVAVSLAATLALVTYTYSIGRLLGPLLAAGLFIFITRARLSGVVRVWLLYALALVPALVFHLRHPGALTGRFSIITYLTPQATRTEAFVEFFKHYAGNFDVWRLLVAGDPNPDQIASIYGTPLLLAATFALALIGLWRVLSRQRSDAWWRFVLYGLAMSAVPASLTNEYTHMLRLSGVPVFLVALTIPALAWLFEGARADVCASDGADAGAHGGGRRRRRAALVLLLLATIVQGAFFQWQYHASARSPRRLHLFDAGYPQTILPAALAGPSRPVYIADALAIPGYIQAYWYATLEGVPLETFERLPADAPPPTGALVITTEENCPRCRILAEVKPYTVYVADQPPRPRAPLPADAFRAEILVPDAPATLRAGRKATLRVLVRNMGSAVWLARERSGGAFQVSLGNHWLDANGRSVTNDDGRSALLEDLAPGAQTELSLVVNAPHQPGDYLLELDMLQEGVSWFGLKGSQTTRLPVRVE